MGYIYEYILRKKILKCFFAMSVLCSYEHLYLLLNTSDTPEKGSPKSFVMTFIQVDNYRMGAEIISTTIPAKKMIICLIFTFLSSQRFSF